MSHKQYWAVWVQSKGITEKVEWCHHGSYDSRSDALEEARSCRRNGEKVEIRRQDW